MDRSVGPRHPDKRNVAYESIFGRPSAVRHQLAPQTTPYPPPYHGPYQPYPPRIPQQVPNQLPYRQPAYPAQPFVSPPYPPQQRYAPSLAPPSVHSRAQSISGSSTLSAGIGIIGPRPDEPPDPSLEQFARQGLTPAQAYQAQVYRTSHNPFRTAPYVTPAPSNELYSNNGGTSNDQPTSYNSLKLSLDVSSDSGNAGFSFDSASPEHSDEENSELPWAQQEPSRSKTLDNWPALIPSRPVSDSAAPSSSGGPNFSSEMVAPPSSARSSLPPPSSPSSTLVDQPSASSVRYSSDSSRTIPRQPNGSSHRPRASGDRSLSLSSSSTTIVASRPSIPNSFAHGSGNESPTTVRSSQPRIRGPVVYPALLSRVAAVFRERILLSDHVKDGLTYKDCFDGREAVDKIAYIIKTTDRNLALLLGRALDAQKFFHDVTYDHRLRDNPGELYQFRMGVPSPFVSGDLAAGGAAQGDHDVPPRPPLKHDSSGETSATGSALSGPTMTSTMSSPAVESKTPARKSSSASLASSELPLPSGVFTLLTDCYSPTCSRDQLCYSIACPRRLEQQARLNMKPQPGLKKEISRESLGDFVLKEPGTLWIHSVPQEIVNSVSDLEKRRQEAINEVIYTERDFVRDMEYLQNSWINPLKDADVIPTERRIDFISQVFWNVHEVIAVNTRLREALNKRQKSYAVVEKIGDILLEYVPHFEPFVTYGAHQLYGKFQFEDEKRQNPAFAAFVESTERMPESRKLELNGYLTKPTTRLARYPLLLEAVLKSTPDDNPDKKLLPQVITLVREFLAKVNTETGKAENRFNLLQVSQQLVFIKPEDTVDLLLQEEGRELIYKGSLMKRGGQGEDLLVYLFDHALLVVKQKSKQNQLRVYRRPIPIELLQIIAPDEFAPNPSRGSGRTHKSIIRRNSLTRGLPVLPAVVPNVKSDSRGYSIEFRHLGRKAYQIVLWASTYVSQRKWVEHIQKQQELLRERSAVFESVTVSEGFFVGGNKVNCAAPFAGARRVVYGTDDGVYISDLRDPTRDPVKVLSLLDVSQVDVLEAYRLLIVLSERQVITFPLEALNPNDPMAGLKRAKRISSHTTFFKVGICLGRTLVCIVKSSPLSSTIKALEPIDQHVRGRAKPTFKKLLQGGNDTLKFFREFYIPLESSSLHFLKTKLCVGNAKGFEIVDLESLDTQGLLDPSDESLDFVKKKENLRPMAIYRIANEFLLCYDEYAFYIDRNGWRSRKEFMVHWEGSPTGFGFHYPYVLAFEPTFVEIRHVETGMLSQIIQGNNLRLLFADTQPSTMNGLVPPPQPQHVFGYNNYAPPGPVQYGGYPVGHGQPLQPPPASPHSGFPNRHPGFRTPAPCRDEILMVSDDRVMTLRAKP